MSKILGQSVGEAAATPILAKDKRVEKKLEAERLERKLQRARRAERREREERGHRDVADYDLAYEKLLKRMATRGGASFTAMLLGTVHGSSLTLTRWMQTWGVVLAVVKLFNAIAKQLKDQEKAADAPIHKQKKGAFRRCPMRQGLADADRIYIAMGREVAVVRQSRR